MHHVVFFFELGSLLESMNMSANVHLSKMSSKNVFILAQLSFICGSLIGTSPELVLPLVSSNVGVLVTLDRRRCDG